MLNKANTPKINPYVTPTPSEFLKADCEFFVNFLLKIKFDTVIDTIGNTAKIIIPRFSSSPPHPIVVDEYTLKDPRFKLKSICIVLIISAISGI